MKNSKGLGENEFNRFFDAIANAALGVTKGEGDCLLDVMKKHGIPEPQLPAPLAAKIMPMLKANLREARAKSEYACDWCDVCGMCHACGELNAGSLGAHSASLLTIAN